MKQIAELLAPAGSVETMYAAFAAGADAVYIGGSRFGARAYADNAESESLLDAIDYAHLHGKKIYLTVNTLLKEQEMDELYEYLLPFYRQGLDAVIVQDFGVFRRVREWFPDLAIHASTQMIMSGELSAEKLKELGATRIVTPRELSLNEIRSIHKSCDLEIESFVHGALCYCYSGQCLFSSIAGGRSGNRGRCAQPCRMAYSVEQNGKVILPQQKGYILSPKDLCTIEILPKLIEAGGNSLKIEGRMKTALYVGTVARTYRMAIDDYLESPDKYYANLDKYRELISQCTFRQYTTGFFFGKPDETTQIYDKNVYERNYVYLGLVGEKVGEHKYTITQKNKFCVGDTIEVMKKDGRDIEVKVISIQDEEGNEMESCPHPQQKLFIDLGIDLELGDILRKKDVVTA